ncbi:tape measure protein [Vibrio metschnikovii]|uniref:tape measure protein n=1 Tax=Vibrio metschnikovii TaxID=28172 RepID=UPI002FC5FCAD
MAIDAGTVYYTVDARTQKALDESERLSVSLNKTGKDMKALDGQTKQLNTSFSKLATVIKTVIAAAALRQAADLVQSYQEMSERVQMATSSTAEFEEVQKRLLKTSNGTYRRLSEAQELYILTADSLRSMGYSTQQAIDVQDSMSYAFVKNATSVDRADAAINAFTKSVNTGRVAADQWQTLVAAIPTVIDDIATATGKTSAEIRALGSTGRITASQLTEGLRKSLSENAKAAEGMANNLTDAGVVVENALTAILDKFEQSTGAIKSFTEGVIKAADYVLEFSEDAEGMASVIKSVEIIAVSTAAVITGKLLGAMALYTQKQVEGIAATVKKNAADKLAAQAALRRAAVEKQAAMAVLATAKADATAAKVGTYAHTVAINNLTAARTAAIAATNAHAVAQANMNRVATVGTVAMTGLRSAMMFLGGPVGVLFLAAAAVTAFATSTKKAKESTDLLSESVEKLGNKTLELRRMQVADELFNMDWADGELKKAEKRIKEINRLKNFVETNPHNAGTAGDARRKNKVVDLYKKELVEQNAFIEQQQEKRALLAKRLAEIDEEISGRGAGKKPPKPPTESGEDEKTKGQKAIDKLTESLRLAKLEGRELAQALALSGLDSKEIEKYGDEIKRLSGELFDLDQAIDNQDAIKDLEKELKLAALTGAELAETQALLSLNEYATPEQIERVKELSRLLYEAKERSKFEDQDPDKNATDFSRKIKDTYDGEPLIERLERERGLVKMYQEMEIGDAKAHADALIAIDKKIADEKKRTNQELLAASSSFFGASADLVSAFAGEQDSAYRGLFAISKAFATANAALQLQNAIANAMALPYPANLPEISKAVALGSQVASSISSVSYGGGRLYGGSVKENGMYRINENGAPEVFNAANGQQYMLPNTRGEVVSNKDASGGGMTVTNYITINTDGSVSGDGDKQAGELGKALQQAVKQGISKEMRQGGSIWQYLQKGKR